MSVVICVHCRAVNKGIFFRELFISIDFFQEMPLILLISTVNSA